VSRIPSATKGLLPAKEIMMRLLSAAKAAGAIALWLGAATAHAQANLVVNGSFESGLASWTTNGFFSQGFDYGIDNLSQSGSNACYGGAIQSLGFLNQTFGTIAGQRYDVDFWLASDGFLPNRFQVLANGQLLLDLEDVLIQPYGARHTAFTAIGPTTSLQFGFRNDAGLLHLDNVTVAAIPEPTTIALLALGLGGVAVRRRQLKAT
jgi:hypothetical protein